MSTSSERVKAWRKATKERIVKAMGAKCQCCGYNRCLDALECHHIDSSTKEFSFGSIRANPSSWKRIYEELKKCILLCCLCHREIHAGIRTLPKIYTQVDPKLENYKVSTEHKEPCPVCNKPKLKWNKTCSHVCAGKLTGKVDWSSVDLYNLLKVRQMSLSAIGRLLGVSDNAVRKRAKKLNLY